MPIARELLSTAMLDHGECSEAVILQLGNPLRIIEGSSPLQERHWLEMQGHVFRIAGLMMNRLPLDSTGLSHLITASAIIQPARISISFALSAHLNRSH